MTTTNEVWNVRSPNPPLSERMSPTPGDAPRDTVDFPMAAETNAESFSAILRAIDMRDGGPNAIVYFPPGRYYLGRPSTPFIPRNVSGPTLDADFVVPEGITLRFAPGATLVPFNYEPIEERFSDRRIRGDTLNRRPRSEERTKVILEIRGRVEAGIQPIFDAVLEDMESRAIYGGAPEALHEAGIVLFTRDKVREVHPEWWGAVVPKAHRDTPIERLPAAVVRRITMALQETVHVAHTRRGAAWYAAGQPAGSAAPPNTLSPTPLPIVLSGEYVLDAEIQIGERWRDGQRLMLNPDGSVRSDTLDAARPPNSDGFVLRGVRGPSPSGVGAATLRAHPTLFRQDGDLLPAPVARAVPESSALLGVRGVFGWLIENVTFDGGLRAARCLTVQSSTRAVQHGGVEACLFANALRSLLHIGGEFGEVRVRPKTRKPEVDSPSLYWSGVQDHLGLRIARCAFSTGDVDAWRARAREVFPGTVDGAPFPLVGVTLRAWNTLFMEMANCTFAGPASPMVRCEGASISFRRCSFDTGRLTSSSPRFTGPADFGQGGVDVFLDFPPREVGVAAASVPEPTCRMKDVVSRSPMLISTFRTHRSSNPPFGAVELMGVEHIPRLRPGDPLPPAILWAGHTLSLARLVLMGCRFVRPRPEGNLPWFQEPVLVDLWAWVDEARRAGPLVDDGTEPLRQLVTVLDAWAREVATGTRTEHSSRGRIVDLGTRVEAASMTPLVARSSGTTLRIALLDRAQEPGYSLPADISRPQVASALMTAQGLLLVDRYSVIPASG